MLENFRGNVLKEAQLWFVLLKKFSLNFSFFVVCNPCQSSPSLIILVPLWFIFLSMFGVFLLYLVSKLSTIFWFFQFKGNFNYSMAKITQNVVNELI